MSVSWLMVPGMKDYPLVQKQLTPMGILPCLLGVCVDEGTHSITLGLGTNVVPVGLPRWNQWQRTHLLVEETKETWVRSLGWEDPLGEGMATQASIFALENPTDREAWQVAVQRVTKTRTRLK